MKIDNSKGSAVDGKWTKPGAEFYDELKSSKELLDEAFLIVGKNAGKDTPYSSSGCKYPHHVIRDGKLVLSIPGVKSAYSRAKQMGAFSGSLKEHLVRHYKELGIYDGSKMESDQKIQENFNVLMEKLGMPYMEADDETLLRTYGDTPKKLMKWMYRNLELEEPGVEWRFRTPEQMIADGRGTSHDMAAFELIMFRAMRLNAGSIFFIEYDAKTGRYFKTHTLTWYGEEGSVGIWWFENAWPGHFGIHGPFNGVDGLIEHIDRLWLKDNPYSDSKPYFSTNGSPAPGMSLAEYTSAWSSTKTLSEEMDWVQRFVCDREFREAATRDFVGNGAILLTSTGFDNPKLKKLFMTRIRYPKRTKVLFIPTAANDKESRSILPACIDEIVKCGIDGENIIWYNLDGSIPKKELEKYDVIYVAGGSETHLLKAVKKDNFGRVIKAVLDKGGVYVGVSAGSMILKELGFIDNDIEPHCRKHTKNGPLPEGKISLSDKQAVWITSDEAVITEAVYYEAESDFMNDRINPDELDDDGNKKNDEELVPIYGVCKAVSQSKLYNDGTPKDAEDLGAIGLHNILHNFGRGDRYEHTIVSFDIEMRDAYSFEQHGIIHDKFQERDTWKGTEGIYVCVMFVPKSEFDSAKKFTKYLVDHQDETMYAYGNLLTAILGKPLKNEKRFFCSSYTGFLLMGSNHKNLHRDFSRLRPEDITILPRSFFLTTAVDRDDYNRQLPELKKKVEEIRKKHEKSIREYNNDLPKLKLKEIMGERKTFDKILDAVFQKVGATQGQS